MARKDLTGQKFGLLTVNEMLYNYNGGRRTYCRCTCDCGETNIIRNVDGLRRGTPSCGCYRRKAIQKAHGRDINGQRFGRLLVLETNWESTPPMVKCQCDCGNIYTGRKGDVQSGHTLSCGCLQRQRASENNYKDRSGEVASNGVKFIEPSFQNEKGVWVYKCLCPKCGDVFEALPAKVLYGHTNSCGCLRDSIPVTIIKNTLIKNNILFKKEYSFKDLVGTNPFRFDFAVFDEYENLLYLIEYDGEQHDKPIYYFGGEEGYEVRKQHDLLKNQYCLDNNILLYRIPSCVPNESIEQITTNIINRRDCGEFMVT